MAIGFQTLEWLFPIVVALHNAEEAVWLPGWSERAGRWRTPVSPRVFRCAAVVLTVLAFVITWLSFRSGQQTVWIYLAFGYMVAMLVYVLVPHVAAAHVLRRYTPGVVTAVVLNQPALSVLVTLALQQGYVSAGRQQPTQPA